MDLAIVRLGRYAIPGSITLEGIATAAGRLAH
jgi:hypothetical protein